MAKTITLNRQKGKIFTVIRQLSQPLLTVKRFRYPLLRLSYAFLNDRFSIHKEQVVLVTFTAEGQT